MSYVNFPKVSIIIPIHNRINQTLLCLASCQKIDYPNFNIVVIDDGSTDNSNEVIKNNFTGVTILKGDGDFWWSKSINTGISYCFNNLTEFILLLNNDNIVDKNIINELVNCAEKHPNSLICSKIYDYNDPKKVFFGGGEANPLYFLPHYQLTPYGKIDCKIYQETREIKYGIGMGILIPASIIKKIGFYNEKYLPHYYSDVEFTLRAKKKGFKTLFTPQAILWNDTNSSWEFPEKNVLLNLFIRKKSPYYYKAVLFMYFNHQPVIYWIPAMLLYLLKTVLPVIIRLVPSLKTIFKNKLNENSKLFKLLYLDQSS